MSGPTPGPWVPHLRENGSYSVGPTPECTVALVNPLRGPATEANARLIAAAPELLAALLGLLRIRHRLPYRDGEVPEVAAAHAAIAKTGGAR